MFLPPLILLKSWNSAHMTLSSSDFFCSWNSVHRPAQKLCVFCYSNINKIELQYMFFFFQSVNLKQQTENKAAMGHFHLTVSNRNHLQRSVSKTMKLILFSNAFVCIRWSVQNVLSLPQVLHLTTLLHTEILVEKIMTISSSQSLSDGKIKY